MNHLFFKLVNLTNDAEIAYLPEVKVSDIETAVKIHKIKIDDIAIYIGVIPDEQ